MGGGDVKLLAAIGAICGAVVGIEAELYAFITAARAAMVDRSKRRAPRSLPRGFPPHRLRRLRQGQ